MLGIRHIIYITFMSLQTVHSWKTVSGDTLTYLWVPKDLCSSKDFETQDPECSPSLEMEIVINGWHHPNFYQMLHGANSTVRLLSPPLGTLKPLGSKFHPSCLLCLIHNPDRKVHELAGRGTKPDTQAKCCKRFLTILSGQLQCNIVSSVIQSPAFAYAHRQ